MEELKQQAENLPPASARELMGMQSVRATFRLSRQTIRTITVVAAQLGIRQKSLFDHLLEDADTLAAVADEIEASQAELEERVQKTYVVSRKTLAQLENVCRVRKTPRDVVIEYSVRRLRPVIEKELTKQKYRREIADEFRALMLKYRRLFEKSAELLEIEDPVHDRLTAAMATLENACQAIEGVVKKGEDLEGNSV